MANLGMLFNSDEVEANQPFDLLPAGKYVAMITANEVRATKDESGSFLWLEMDIIEGPYQGRKLWDRLNIWNTSEDAARIAQSTLSAICKATGVVAVEDADHLMHKPILVTVKVRPERTDKKTGNHYDAQNEVKGYQPVSEASAVNAPPPAQTRPAASPPGVTGRPAPVRPAAPPVSGPRPVAANDRPAPWRRPAA